MIYSGIIRLEKFLTGAKVLGALLGLIVGGFLASWILDNDPPSHNLHAALMDSHAHPGSTITQKVTLDRKRICPITVTRVLYDSGNNRFILSGLSADAPGPLGKDEYYQEISIPQKALPGPARLYISLSWECNPIHKIFPIVGTPVVYKIMIDNP